MVADMSLLCTKKKVDTSDLQFFDIKPVENSVDGKCGQQQQVKQSKD